VFYFFLRKGVYYTVQYFRQKIGKSFENEITAKSQASSGIFQFLRTFCPNVIDVKILQYGLCIEKKLGELLFYRLQLKIEQICSKIAKKYFLQSNWLPFKL